MGSLRVDCFSLSHALFCMVTKLPFLPYHLDKRAIGMLIGKKWIFFFFTFSNTKGGEYTVFTIIHMKCFLPLLSEISAFSPFSIIMLSLNSHSNNVGSY